MISGLSKAELNLRGRKIHLSDVMNVDISFSWFAELGVGDVVFPTVSHFPGVESDNSFLRMSEQ